MKNLIKRNKALGQLTDREMQVLKRIANGQSTNRQLIGDYAMQIDRILQNKKTVGSGQLTEREMRRLLKEAQK
tara:strand:- start:293 stop:511 length:219 start_codon:yes stop_codon:yes gene_type:complete